MMQSLKCLIFDEADQMLEMGFRPAITKMLTMLPSKNTRQTLLFSATMPKSILGIAQFALRTKYDAIDCVGEEQSTHERVPQVCIVHPIERQFVELGLVLQEGMKVPDYKIICFFVTARLTQLFSEVFNKVRKGKDKNLLYVAVQCV